MTVLAPDVKRESQAHDRVVLVQHPASSRRGCANAFEYLRSGTALADTRHMNITANFEIDDLDYLVTADSVVMPTQPTRDDPGDGGEVEVSDKVTCTPDNGEHEIEIPYARLLELLAASRGVTVARAETIVEDALMARALDCLDDAFDDSEHDAPEFDDSFDAYLDGHGDA